MGTEIAEPLIEWQEWRARRAEWLSTPHGWLSPTALHWLTSTAEPLPGLPGRWWFDDEGIWIDPDDDTVALDDTPIIRRTRVADAVGARAGDLRHGERALEIIARGEGNRGIRVRDPQAPGRTGFTGVPVFDFDPGWRIRARFEPLAEPKSLPVGSAAERVQHVRRIIGHAVFERDGGEHRLAISAGHATQIAFRDATSGVETFGLMRQLDVEPRDDGTVLLDFNRAASPPCSFSDYGTCPLPLPENTLPFSVTAGEKTPLRPS